MHPERSSTGRVTSFTFSRLRAQMSQGTTLDSAVSSSKVDSRGKVISIGDIIVYATRKGSDTFLKELVVICLSELGNGACPNFATSASVANSKCRINSMSGYHRIVSACGETKRC